MGFLKNGLAFIVCTLGGVGLLFGGMFAMIESMLVGGLLAIIGLLLVMYGERSRRAALGS